MNEEIKRKSCEQFYEAVLSLETHEECFDFFDDLCTQKELEAFVLRLQVAKRLLQGETYQMIEIETNARSNLIFRMKKCLFKEQKGLKMTMERLTD